MNKAMYYLSDQAKEQSGNQSVDAEKFDLVLLFQVVLGV